MVTNQSRLLFLVGLVASLYIMDLNITSLMHVHPNVRPPQLIAGMLENSNDEAMEKSQNVKTPDGTTAPKEIFEVKIQPFAIDFCQLGAPPPHMDVNKVIKGLVGKFKSTYLSDSGGASHHLGGSITNDSATFEGRLWKWALGTLPLDTSTPSWLDVGCGMGFSTEYILHHTRAKNVMCIEGSNVGVENSLVPCNTVQQDFTKGAYVPRKIYDIVWCAEMLEHVEEKYMDNYMAAFKKARYALVTHGSPGQSGFHHVNNQAKEYWIEKFAENGFEFQPELTKKGRELANLDYGLWHQCSEWYPTHPKFNPRCTNIKHGRENSHFHTKGLIFKNLKI
jgi:hypothetical protein